MNEPPRVEMLAVADAKAAARGVDVPDYIAELNVFRTLLHHPPLAARVNDALAQLLFRNTFDTRLRELVIMRVGWLTGSVYEWTQHWRIAGLLEVDSEDLLAVRDWEHSARFDDVARAVLSATDQMVAGGVVDDATWASLEAHLGSREALLELVASVGLWHMISMMLRNLRIELEDGVDPWPPDGVGPPGGGGGATSRTAGPDGPSRTARK